MVFRRKSRLLWWAGRLVICALALAACAAPATVAPTATPTEPSATATALLPTTAATPRNTPAPINIPVPATSISLSGPGTVAFDANNNMYLSECGFRTLVYRIDPYGQLTIFAGTGGLGFSGDGGQARLADLACPAGLAFNRDGNLYVADTYNHRIRRIDRAGIITTVAGSGPVVNGAGANAGGYVDGDFGGDGGPATAARLSSPTNITFDAAGNLFIADNGNDRIRKLDKNGIITTVAGNGTVGFAGDGGPATAARLNGPGSIAFDTAGNLYIADGGNNRIRRIDPRGIITTIAGNGGPTVSGDGGPASAAALSSPSGLAFDANGNLFIACRPDSFAFGTRIRKVDTQGIITTAYGTGAMGGYSGDGGPATNATFGDLVNIIFDPNGNLYVVGANVVRRIDTKGIIQTVAGGHY